MVAEQKGIRVQKKNALCWVEGGYIRLADVSALLLAREGKVGLRVCIPHPSIRESDSDAVATFLENGRKF